MLVLLILRDDKVYAIIFDADLEVVKWLKENDKLFKKQKIKHDYPHCWRCDSPLVYYSRPSFYLEVTKSKIKLLLKIIKLIGIHHSLEKKDLVTG